MKITSNTYTTYTLLFFCQKQLHILHIQLKILWSLFSKEWCIHAFSWLFGKSNLSVYLAVTEIGNTSGNISWTVVLERNIYGSTAMPGGWCPVLQVLHTEGTSHTEINSIQLLHPPEWSTRYSWFIFFLLCGSKFHCCEFFLNQWSEYVSELVEDIRAVWRPWLEQAYWCITE